MDSLTRYSIYACAILGGLSAVLSEAANATATGTMPSSTTAAAVTVYLDPCSAQAFGASGTNTTISSTNYYLNAQNQKVQTTACYNGVTYPATSSAVVVNTLNIAPTLVQSGGQNIGADGYAGASGAYIAYPSNTQISPRGLLVFLGGTGSYPNSYTQFLQRAASDGYVAIAVYYNDATAAATKCGSGTELTGGTVTPTTSPCYEQFRGDAVFGSCSMYALSAETPELIGNCPATSYRINNVSVHAAASTSNNKVTLNATGSAVNAAVDVLQYLANWVVVNQPGWVPGTNATYWNQFLTATPPGGQSYYTGGGSFNQTNNVVTSTSPNPGVTLAWSNITLAGHSQGAGDAAFLATHLAAGSVVQKLILLSAPEDWDNAPFAKPFNASSFSSSNPATSCNPPVNHSNGDSGGPCPAAWMTENLSGISANALWGLRSTNEWTTAPYGSYESSYGAQAENNWGALGLPGSDNVGQTGRCFAPSASIPAGVTACPANGSHRLGIWDPFETAQGGFGSLDSHDSSAVDPPVFSDLDPDIAYAWDVMLLGTYP